MDWLTVQYYRSLLSDVANYVLSDWELQASINAVVEHNGSLLVAIAFDEDYAAWSLR